MSHIIQLTLLLVYCFAKSQINVIPFVDRTEIKIRAVFPKPADKDTSPFDHFEKLLDGSDKDKNTPLLFESNVKNLISIPLDECRTSIMFITARSSPFQIIDNLPGEKSDHLDYIRVYRDQTE